MARRMKEGGPGRRKEGRKERINEEINKQFHFLAFLLSYLGFI